MRFGYFKTPAGQYVVWRLLTTGEHEIMQVVSREHEAMDLVKQLEAEDF